MLIKNSISMLRSVENIEPLVKWISAQVLHYAWNFIVGISAVCLRYDFLQALILSERPRLARGSIESVLRNCNGMDALEYAGPMVVTSLAWR